MEVLLLIRWSAKVSWQGKDSFLYREQAACVPNTGKTGIFEGLKGRNQYS